MNRPRITHTRTYAIMEVSEAVWNEVAGKFREAGYDHAFIEPRTLDMHGIALVIEPENPFKPKAHEGPKDGGVCPDCGSTNTVGTVCHDCGFSAE